MIQPTKNSSINPLNQLPPERAWSSFATLVQQSPRGCGKFSSWVMTDVDSGLGSQFYASCPGCFICIAAQRPSILLLARNDSYGVARFWSGHVFTLKLQCHSFHFAWCQQIWTIPIWPPVVSPPYRAFLIFIQNAPHFLPIICSQDRRTFQKPAAHRHLLGCPQERLFQKVQRNDGVVPNIWYSDIFR